MLNAYTDEPELHSNLWLGSLQLLVWLVFHPSAWRNHVKRIDPNLPPNFCLLQLEREHWRNPALRRLLVMGYVVWPLLISGFLPIISLLLRLENIIPSILFGLGAALSIGLFIGIVLGLGVGVISLIVSYVIFGLSVSILSGQPPANQTHLTLMLVIYGIAFNIFSGVVGVAASNLSGQKTPSHTQQWMGSVVVGISFSVLVYLIGYLIVIHTGGKSVFNLAFGGLPNFVSGTTNKLIYSAIFMVVAGVGFSTAGSLRTHKWHRSLMMGVLIGIITGWTLYVTSKGFNYLGDPLLSGIAGGGWLAGVLVLSYGLAEYFAGPQAGAVAGAFGLGGAHTIFYFVANESFSWPVLFFTLACILIGLTLVYWLSILVSPFREAWNLILYRSDERGYSQPSLLRLRSEFWNELQRRISPSLRDHLVLIVSRNPDEGQAAIDYLATTRHRPVARQAQIELDALRLERCESVQAIGQAYHHIGEVRASAPVNELLGKFREFSLAVEGALDRTNALSQFSTLSEIEEQLSQWQHSLTHVDKAYADRFQHVAGRWQDSLATYLAQLAQSQELRQHIESPYKPSLALEESDRHIFAGRNQEVKQIEQFLLDPHRPPLLLYGQRRMGKTSLLKNLGRLLRSKMTAVPMLVDGQGLTVAGNLGEFLSEFSDRMRRSAWELRQATLPRIDEDALLSANPLLPFKRWLDEVEVALQAQGYAIGLLMLDEIEFTKEMTDRGRFDVTDIFSLLRHIIQHRPFFKLMFAGSHTLEEFETWASYLINTQVMKISYLQEVEARRLIEYPVENFPLRYEPAAVQHILSLTRCHPQLVQLLCDETVQLKNSQEGPNRLMVRVDEVERAATQALGSGDMFFANIKDNIAQPQVGRIEIQVGRVGLQILTYLAAQGAGAVVCWEDLSRQINQPLRFERALALLDQRDLIEQVDGGYRFEVELVRRWFTRPHIQVDSRLPGKYYQAE